MGHGRPVKRWLKSKQGISNVGRYKSKKGGAVMSEEKVPTREEKLAPVIARAWQDEAYRKELVANPKGVLRKEFGVELPEGLAIEVLEESPAKLYIVIPPKPTDELSDEQLEGVAGGVCIPAVIIGGIVGGIGGLSIGLGAAQGQRRGW
jgi:hypothetical protein